MAAKEVVSRPKPDKTQNDTGKFDPQEIADSAFNNPEIGKIYINGFLTGHSNSDMHLILMQNGVSTNILNMSFTTAKTLYASLGQLISEFEAKTNHTVMVMQEIAESMEKSE